MPDRGFQSVDEYISAVSSEMQVKLNALKELIRKLAQGQLRRSAIRCQPSICIKRFRCELHTV